MRVYNSAVAIPLFKFNKIAIKLLKDVTLINNQYKKIIDIIYETKYTKINQIM